MTSDPDLDMELVAINKHGLRVALSYLSCDETVEMLES